MAYGVGQVQQGPVLSPADHLANALKLRADQLEIDQRTQETAAKLRADAENAKEQAWLSTAVKTYTHDDGSPDWDTIGNAAMQVSPALGQKVVDWNGKRLSQAAQTRKAEVDNEKADFDEDIHKLERVTDPSSFALWVPRIKDPHLLQAIGPQFNEQTPQTIRTLIASGLDQTHWLGEQSTLAGEYGKDPEGAFLKDLRISRNDDDLKNAYDAFRAHASADTVNRYQQMFGTTWAPEVPARAAERSMTANESATNARAVTSAATTAHNEAVNQALRGREVAVQERNASRLEGEQGAAAPMQMGSVDPNAPHGADYLKTLPPQQQPMVKALAEGRQPWPSSFALSKPYWQDLMQKVFQYDPTFDTSQASSNARQKTRNDFTSGASAKQINALNTVVGHLGTLAQAGEGLSNTSQPWFNSVKNFLKAGTGSPSVVNFETAKEAVASELVRVWRQAGGAEADIKAWKEQISSSNSPAQLNAAFTQIGHLLESKLESMQEQYRQGMGTDDIHVITPEARKALDKLEGVAPSAAPAAPGKQKIGRFEVEVGP